LTLWGIALPITLAAQSIAPSSAVGEGCRVAPPGYREWIEKTQLRSGEPFVIGEARKLQVLENYSKLKLQMRLEQAEQLLGKPDFSVALPLGHLSKGVEPEKHICETRIAYVFYKASTRMADTGDVVIYLTFSPESQLTWAIPENLPKLNALGGPTRGLG
jgi:hypothetical protein